jgi:uncharacterized protein (DUF2126 family)
VSEAPHVTNSLTDKAWAALDALGEKVDADLAASDVRLTMGGEPTFVAIEGSESSEWTIAALGPEKRARADELVRRLRERFAPKVCCTTGWASGTRARLRRAGRSRSTGGATANRCGAMRR